MKMALKINPTVYLIPQQQLQALDQAEKTPCLCLLCREFESCVVDLMSITLELGTKRRDSLWGTEPGSHMSSQ